MCAGGVCDVGMWVLEGFSCGYSLLTLEIAGHVFPSIPALVTFAPEIAESLHFSCFTSDCERISRERERERWRGGIEGEKRAGIFRDREKDRPSLLDAVVLGECNACSGYGASCEVVSDLLTA